MSRSFSIGVTVLTGCSSQNNDQAAQPSASESSQTETGSDLLAQIQEKGEIVIAMEGTWAPWTYHDENDELVGYDVEVGKAIAEKLGVTATFVEGEWDGLLAGLDAGRYDITYSRPLTDLKGSSYGVRQLWQSNGTVGL